MTDPKTLTDDELKDQLEMLAMHHEASARPGLPAIARELLCRWDESREKLAKIASSSLFCGQAVVPNGLMDVKFYDLDDWFEWACALAAAKGETGQTKETT